MQADTATPGAGPLAWDRYAYVEDNPLRYTDPSGHAAVCGVGIEDCGGSIQNNTVPSGPPIPTPAPVPEPAQTNQEPKPTVTPVPPAPDFLLSPPPYPPTVYGPCVTPLPGMTCQPSSLGYLYLRPEVGFDWSKIDKGDLAIDVFGILGDVVKGAGLPGMLIYGISEAAELADAAGKIKAIYDLGTGDGAGELFEGVELLGKEIPNSGAYVNATSMVWNLKNGFFVYYDWSYYYAPIP